MRHSRTTPGVEPRDEPAADTGLRGLRPKPGAAGCASVLGLQRAAGNRATSGVLGQRAIGVQRGSRDLDAPAVPLPETTALTLTGGYEALEPGGNNRITMQFNQAGYHLEGWYQRRESFSVGGLQRQTMTQNRIVANLVSDNAGEMVFEYRRFDPATPGEVSAGTLTARAGRHG